MAAEARRGRKLAQCWDVYGFAAVRHFLRAFSTDIVITSKDNTIITTFTPAWFEREKKPHPTVSWQQDGGGPGCHV
jgi:hypothetical protein